MHIRVHVRVLHNLLLKYLALHLNTSEQRAAKVSLTRRSCRCRTRSWSLWAPTRRWTSRWRWWSRRSERAVVWRAVDAFARRTAASRAPRAGGPRTPSSTARSTRSRCPSPPTCTTNSSTPTTRAHPVRPLVCTRLFVLQPIRYWSTVRYLRVSVCLYRHIIRVIQIAL